MHRNFKSKDPKEMTQHELFHMIQALKEARGWKLPHAIVYLNTSEIWVPATQDNIDRYVNAYSERFGWLPPTNY